MAIKKAQEYVKETGDLSVPLPLRNAPTKLMKDLGYGENYKYAHDFEDNFTDLEFLPEQIKGTSFYIPGNNKREIALKEFLEKRWGKKY
jgi:putative ATPase